MNLKKLYIKKNKKFHETIALAINETCKKFILSIDHMNIYSIRYEFDNPSIWITIVLRNKEEVTIDLTELLSNISNGEITLNPKLYTSLTKELVLQTSISKKGLSELLSIEECLDLLFLDSGTSNVPILNSFITS